MKFGLLNEIQLNLCILLTFCVSFNFLIVNASDNDTLTPTEDSLDEDESATLWSTDSLKNITDELQENLRKLTEDQTKLSEQFENKLTNIEDRLNNLEERVNSTLNSDILFPLHPIHKKHQEELKDLRGLHENLANSVAKMYHHVHHLAKMHNVSVRLERTAQLVVEERWSEASLHWTFLEKHTFDEDLLEDYLESVIVLAYGQRNKSHLIPIFKFVHKLSFKEYKVYAYETLIHQMLYSQNNLWDGSEIFILAHFVRKNYGTNSKGNSKLPTLVKALTSGVNVKLVYLPNYTDAPQGPSTEPTTTTKKPESKGGHGSSGGGGHYKLKRIDQGAIDLAADGGLEVHIRGDVIQTKYDKPKSFNYPVYGSKYKTYNSSFSAMWLFIYQDNGFFIVKNLQSEGYLHVPENDTEFLNTVPLLDKDRHNLEFKFIYKDSRTMLIESTGFPHRPLQAVPQSEDQQDEIGILGIGSRNVCFKVGDEESETDQQQARFTILQ